MPSPAMLNLIDAFRDRRAARTGQAPPTLDELRAGFAPAGRVYPLPDDVLVAAVTAGGVPAYWLDAPDIGPSQVLLKILSHVPILTGGFPRRAMTRHWLTPMCVHCASIGSNTTEHRPALPNTAPLEDRQNQHDTGIERHHAARQSS